MSIDRVALLIDADNVSVDVIEQAVAWIAQRWGGPHVRRAYCTAEMAVKHQDLFKRLSIRPMVNLAAGKNSTDIALAVDAIDLVVSDRPSTVVIASSDSDFAPLVSRLREKGCRVVGIGQKGKTGDETQALYDEFEVLSHRPAGREAKARGTGRSRSSAKSTLPTPAASAVSANAVREGAARTVEPEDAGTARLFEQFVDLIEKLPDEPGAEESTSSAGPAADAGTAPPAPAKRGSRGRGRSGKGARASAAAKVAAEPAAPALEPPAARARSAESSAAQPDTGVAPPPAAARKRSSRGRGRGGKGQKPQTLKSGAKP